MIKYYTNRVLAHSFDTNLAKWKRWSREFLPPDPLGGMQSGFARQYHPDQALTVRLGGYLVSDLKFSIPEARRILADLREWMRAEGFFFSARVTAAEAAGDGGNGPRHRLLFVSALENQTFAYALGASAGPADGSRWVLEGKSGPVAGRDTGARGQAFDPVTAAGARCLNLTVFLAEFAGALGLDRRHYRALGRAGGVGAP